MGDYENTRKQIIKEFNNEDLKEIASVLTNIIEYMSNSTSNFYSKKGIYNFDIPEIEDNLNRAKSKLKSIMVIE